MHKISFKNWSKQLNSELNKINRDELISGLSITDRIIVYKQGFTPEETAIAMDEQLFKRGKKN